MLKISPCLRPFVASVVGLGLASSLKAQGHWPFWGYDISNNKHPAVETAISPAQVKHLKKEWVFEARSSVYVFPTIQDHWLYFTDYPLFSAASVIDPKVAARPTSSRTAVRRSLTI